MEKEEDNGISFLDVAVTRRNRRFTTDVYRKPTYTDLYTHYTSHHHPCVKAGTVRCLGLRAETICDGESRRKELKHLKDTFRRNGFPKKVIARNLIRIAPTTHGEEEEEERATDTDKPRLLYLPYLKGLLEKIRRACKKIAVRAVFKSSDTLREMLTRVKSPIPYPRDEQERSSIPDQL
jgi:hypothetical protein